MQLKRPEQLEERLAQGLDGVYLVTGDEPLLVQEAAEAVRTAVRAAGIDERELFHVEAGFDWDAMLQSAGSMSLFASRRLIELRLSSPRPGDAGSKALLHFAEQGSDDVLLVIAPRLDASAQRTRWYKALEGAGVHLPLWPVGLDEMPRWLEQRARRAGVALSRDGFDALLARVEGNLLAASQAVARLALEARESPWDADALAAALDDDSRYTPFELVDCMLAADARRAHHILLTLRLEGTEPLALVGVLARELRTLLACHEALARGQALDGVMKQLRVFFKRQRLVKDALGRLRPALIEGALRDLAVVDQSVKGMLPIEPWDELDRLVLRLCGVGTTPLGVRARAWLETG